MKFLADENCDALMVRTLREAGYDVNYIAQLAPSIDDPDILALSLADERVLITEDLDFCDWVFRDEMPAYAIILIRILPAQRALKARRVMELITTYGDELVGAFTSLSVDDMRVRPLPGRS